jgi:hypothetical protein
MTKSKGIRPGALPAKGTPLNPKYTPHYPPKPSPPPKPKEK